MTAVTLICAAPMALKAQDQTQPAEIGGRFMLEDQTGKVVTDKDFEGRFMLITFGYTFCPDVCPTNLVNMSDALDVLGDQASKIVPIFVTVDPARDDAKRLREYVSNFDKRLVGLTGPQPLIDSITQRYKITAEVHHPKDWGPDEYTIDHTASIFLMSPEGDFLVKFAHGMAPADMAKRIQDFIP